MCDSFSRSHHRLPGSEAVAAVSLLEGMSYDERTGLLHSSENPRKLIGMTKPYTWYVHYNGYHKYLPTFTQENIPPQYRTIPGIARFTLSLLSTNHSPTHVHRTRIQGIFLPPHHQDQPGDHPKCKGFALVTLQYPSDINFLLHRWPWDRSLNATQATDGLGAFPDALEASKFGFRTLPKTRWDELRDEYLAYRKRLVQEINAFEDAEALIHAPSASLAARKSLPAPPSRDVSEVNDAPLVDLSSPYPINSLIFVRNVHIETNKTTLRKLFATAFVMPLKNGVVRSDGIDYVDYNKGMDTVSLTQRQSDRTY